MARPIELLNLLVQAQQTQHRQQSRGGRDDLNPQVASYQDFLSTQPLFFSKAEEPLDADAWLHTIKLKFALLTIPCVDSSKAHFAASNFVVLPVFGGVTIVPCNLMAMLSPGKNFGLLLGHIIFLKD
jgi:hypothetical protein